MHKKFIAILIILILAFMSVSASTTMGDEIPDNGTRIGNDDPVAVIGPDPDQNPTDWWIDPPENPDSPHFGGYVANYSIEMFASDSYSPIGADITGYMWDFGNGHTGTGEIAQCTNQNYCHQQGHRYYYPGVYWIQLWVTDADGRVGWCDHWINVTKDPGIAPEIVNFVIEPNPAPVNTEVELSAYATDQDGHASLDIDIIYYKWDFDGDGIWDTNPTELGYVYHVYTEPGDYNVMVAAMDGPEDHPDTLTGIDEKDLTITGSGDPGLKKDNSDITGTTGDEFQFNISAFNNADIASVYVKWSHGDSSGNESLSKTGVYWTGTITLDNNLEVMTYTIYIKDTSNNYNISSMRTVDVSDTDPPKLVQDRASVSGSTGANFTFEVIATDNFELETVSVRYTYDFNNYTTIPLIHENNDIWTLDIIIPDNASMIAYSYLIMDVNGNELDTSISQGEITVDILDTIKPTAVSGKDRTIEQYQTIFLDGSNSTDNIGIIEYLWKFTYEGDEELLYEMTTEFRFENAGIYNISLRVTDEDGNWAMDYFIITVKDVILPVVQIDNIRDQNEGSSITFKGGSSSDNVGIVNYTWTFDYRGMTIRLYNETASYVFIFPGEYNISLTVTDGDGNKNSDYVKFKILDKTVPDVNISISGNYVHDGDRIDIEKGKKVIMDSSLSFDNVEITNRTWNIKSKHGTVERFTEIEEYIFDKAGTYTITLSILDAADNSGEITFKIIVNEPPISSTVEGTEESSSSTWVYVVVIIVIVLVIIALIGIFLRKKRGGDDDYDYEDYHHDDRVSMNNDYAYEEYPRRDRQFSPKSQEQSFSRQRTQPIPPEYFKDE